MRADAGARALGQRSLFHGQWFETAAGLLIGILTAVAIVVAGSGGTKELIIVLGALLAAAMAGILTIAPGHLERLALFGLAATLSLSLKVHPIFRMDHLGGAIGLRISATEILVAVLAAMAVRSAGRRGTLIVRFDRFLAVTGAVYLCFGVLSTFGSDDPQLGWFELSAVVEAFAVCATLAGRSWIGRTRHLFVVGLLLTLVLQSGVAIVQSLRPGLISAAKLGVIADSGEDDGGIPESDVGTTTIEGETTTRPTGFLVHPNVLAAYLVLTIPLAIAVALVGATRSERLLAMLACATSAAALYLSLSRSGWIGTAAAVGLGALLAWRWKMVRLTSPQRFGAALVCLALCSAAVWKADKVYLRFVETASEAVQFRRDLDVTAWNMATAHPYAGVGLNTFIYHAEDYDSSGTSRLKLFPAHNVYLLELAEVGFPGGLAFGFLVAAMLAATFGAARAARSEDQGLIVLALAAGLAGFWLTQLSDYVYRIPVLTSLVWGHAGLALGLSRKRAE